MYLGKVIQWNSKDPRAAERYAYVAKEILHLPGETNEELIAALVQKIRDLNDQLNIPQSIKDYANGGVKVDARTRRWFRGGVPRQAARDRRERRAGRLHAREPA